MIVESVESVDLALADTGAPLSLAICACPSWGQRQKEMVNRKCNLFTYSFIYLYTGTGFDNKANHGAEKCGKPLCLAVVCTKMYVEILLKVPFSC